MKRFGRNLPVILFAITLGGLVSGGCATNRAGQTGDPNSTGDSGSYDGTGSIDPYDSAEIPPEALEFPEPPGAETGLAGDLGPVAGPAPTNSGGSAISDKSSDPASAPEPPAPAEVPGTDLMIPDVSGKIPVLPPLLEPRGRDGFIDLEDRNDVVDKFEMPTRMENARFVYSRHRSFPDFKQVVFAFDIKGKLKRVDLFPSRVITRQQLIERYGGGFSRKASGSYEILNYRRIRLVFFLLTANDTVHSIRLKK